MDDYGNDHEALAKYIRGFQNDTVSVQLTEVCRFGDSFHVDKSTITDVRKLKTHLDKEVQRKGRLSIILEADGVTRCRLN